MPAGRPNYALRRVMFLAGVALVLYGGVQVTSWAASDGSGAVSSTTEPAAGSAADPAEVEPVALVAPPECAIGETPTESSLAELWQRSVVDIDHRLPADYVPPDLTAVSAAGFDAPFEVREVVVDDLAALREAAEANGTPVEVVAAYRSVGAQQDLFSRRVAELGFEAAAARTARPGHSEHHLGTAIDFKTAGAADVFQSWADEPTGRFVLENAHRFGFVNTYPRDSESRTCYDFEPWHFRYFGVDLAIRIHDSGLTAREYLWHWQETGSEPAL